jgi:hypothetical protein
MAPTWQTPEEAPAEPVTKASRAPEPKSTATTAPSARTVRPPRKRRPTSAPAPRYSDTAIRPQGPQGGGGAIVQRSYVLSPELEIAIQNAVLDTGRTINQVVRDALDRLLTGLEYEGLRAAEKAPIKPDPEPEERVRRTISIHERQDQLLRVLRVRFKLQASAVVRLAIKRYVR